MWIFKKSKNNKAIASCILYIKKCVLKLVLTALYFVVFDDWSSRLDFWIHFFMASQVRCSDCCQQPAQTISVALCFLLHIRSFQIDYTIGGCLCRMGITINFERIRTLNWNYRCQIEEQKTLYFTSRHFAQVPLQERI